MLNSPNPIASAPAANEILLLETLNALLAVAIRSLRSGEADDLLRVSRDIRSTADNLLTLMPDSSLLPRTDDEQKWRRQRLAELTQQRCFCRALLRRWRRSILLRRQLQQMRGEPGAYTDSFADPGYGL